jgi:FKBP-type peptidyl-prolyl cis-trans isomerase SlyD
VSVASGKVVVIHYTLTGADGRLIESTRGKAPMAYLHGQNNVIPGLEAALADKNVGDQVQFTIPPEQAYGVRKGKGPQAVPRKEFPRKMDLRENMPLDIPGGDGQPVRVWVTKIQGSKVWIDVDHPLAGQSLSFDVEIVHIRDPYPEEIEHGHAHGSDGHHHH